MCCILEPKEIYDRHFHWIEDPKNITIWLRKVEEHLMVMEKKMDKLAKLVKVVRVPMLILIVVKDYVVLCCKNFHVTIR